MLAADNGQHTDYSDLADAERKGGAGFPILHSSPMANFGSSKTGPMSEGCFAYKIFPNYQYATLEITYPTQGDVNGTGGDGTPVCYSYKGWVAGESDSEVPQISAGGCITPGNPSWVVRGLPDGGRGKCEIPLWPAWVTAVVVVASVAVLCAAGVAVYCAGVKKHWWAAARYRSVGTKSPRRRREDTALRDFAGVQEQP
ncbi:MAG: hypothetical protein BJ554DRAFT_5603 [Olpidium bornovanus]|uniref:Uncharacterized protein n=1 Tax=Olpidium bornovanus TaxID=278681 RepID=A0A8H7ZZB0_9FUNG|nr:MAG: hypothetical protein BJ554DRAFT_5603 [Olpidium bornovanus]